MLTAADVMTTDVCTIRSSAKVTEAILLMQNKQVRSLIVEKVVRGGAYGIVTERDIVYKVMANGADPFHMRVCEIMQSNCIAIAPSMSLSAVAKRFTESGLQKAPVVDKDALLGMISITDLIRESNVAPLELPEHWADSAEIALRHKQLCWGDECEVREESAIAKEVLEQLVL